MQLVYACTFTMLAVAGLLVTVRLLRGPAVPDRILAIDVLSVLLAGGIAVDSARRGFPEALTLVLVVALLGFVSTVLAARFAGARGMEEAEEARQ
ncbi:MAG TPA: monovalent cation/H+ antiporter complex subunit F [Micromonosporaceae bacterium]|nr:monovalent cation/H+ antiporter complex subunit F [Micromonosporaceae bacterium]